jgi:hypothetical protein
MPILGKSEVQREWGWCQLRAATTWAALKQVVSSRLAWNIGALQPSEAPFSDLADQARHHRGYLLTKIAMSGLRQGSSTLAEGGQINKPRTSKTAEESVTGCGKEISFQDAGKAEQSIQWVTTHIQENTCNNSVEQQELHCSWAKAGSRETMAPKCLAFVQTAPAGASASWTRYGRLCFGCCFCCCVPWVFVLLVGGRGLVVGGWDKNRRPRGRVSDLNYCTRFPRIIELDFGIGWKREK